MQTRDDSRPMVEVYKENNDEIQKMMNQYNRTAAYIANYLIEQSLVKSGKLKKGVMTL